MRIPSALFIAILIWGSASLAPVWSQVQPDENLLIEQAHAMRTSHEKVDSAVPFLDGIGPRAAAISAGASQDGTVRHIALVWQDGEDNHATLLQSGALNVAVVMQLGDLNETWVEQDGSGNVVGARLQGDRNRLSVSQRGDDNTYLLDFTGSSLDHTVVQHGTGMRAVQVGAGSRPFGIEQRGSGAEVTIEHY
jgi:hypothetical protein